MTIPAIVNPLKSSFKSFLQGAVQGKSFTDTYNIKANPNVVGVPHFKNELVYSADYREWTVYGVGSIKSVAGIHLVASGGTESAALTTQVKGNTKYGLLYNVLVSTLVNFLKLNSQYTGTAFNVPKLIGNNKISFTTQATITTNKLEFYLPAENADGQYIDLKDIRLFELPLNSEIEADFTALSADALMAKYNPSVIVPGELKATVLGRTLKNELDYTPATYAEWTVAGTGSTKGSTGIHLVAEGNNEYAELSVVCKSNQKYGVLYNVLATDLLADKFYISSTSIIGVATLIPQALGNNKATFTTANPIANNTLRCVTGSSSTDGTYIDFKDIRLYELPTGSEIESDFTNMTADQLALKYPMSVGTDGKTGGVKSVGSAVATNLLANGNFAQGTTGWVTYLGSLTEASGIGTFIASGQYGFARVALSSTVIGKKYYAMVNVKASSNLVQLGFTSSSFIAHSGSGNFERLSMLITATTTGHLPVVRDDRGSGFDEIQIDNLMCLCLSDIFGTGNEPSKATCDKLFADWFSGSRSITRLRSVGKNLCNISTSDVITGSYYGSSGSIASSGNAARSNNYFRVLPNTRYICTDRLVNQYDQNKVHIQRIDSGGSFVTPSNCYYVRISVVDGVTYPLTLAQLEQSSTATTYEPYRETTCLIPAELRSIGTVSDSFDASSGTFTKRISDWVTLDGSLLWGSLVTNTNTYRMQTNWGNGKNVYHPSIDASVVYSYCADGYIGTTASATTDSRHFSIYSNNVLYMVLEKAKIDAMAGATVSAKFATYLNTYPISFIYQLDNPVITKYEPITLGSALTAERNGTLYVERVDGSPVGVVPNLQMQYERGV